MKAPKLFAKPLLFMVIIFGIMSVASTVMFGNKLETELIREYESKALALARSMAEADVHSIINGDATSVQARIDLYREIEGVSYVIVADGDHNVMAHTFVPIIPKQVEKLVSETRTDADALDQHLLKRISLNRGEECLHVSQPILAGLGGYVHIGMGLNPVKQQIRASILRFQLFVFFIFVASVVTGYFFFEKISRPIQALALYAKRVAKHDFSAELNITSNDEVGELANAMQSMAKDIDDMVTTLEDRVHQKTMELQEAKNALEQKVSARTSELTRANTQLKVEVAERRVIGEALRKAEQKYRSIFENAVEGIYQATPTGRFISANPALAKIFGYHSPDELTGSIYDAKTQVYVDPKRRDEFTWRMTREGEVKNFESQARRRDGNIIWITESARVVRDSKGMPLYYEGSIEDVTLRKKAEEQLRRQAFQDPLTSLPNRALFLDHLRMALERSKRRNYLFAVLYLDLDRFKVINDSLGHEIGDELLKTVSRVLESCARTMDTVARFGGDEFAILLEEISAPRDAIRIARRILNGISQPFNLRGNEVFTSASIGIVLHTEGYDRPDALLRDADTAMYRAKELGKARFKVFNQKMHDQALRLMALETDLRRAVDLREFEVHYQPVVSLEDRRISSVEALVRWRHQEHGMVSPSDFIPVAEDTGLIYAIDNQVLSIACRAINRLNRKYHEFPPISLNLNLSGKHFGQVQLVSQIANALDETGLPPHLLNLELTESALVAHPTLAGELLNQLKSLGLTICIDDFGTGYSSLSYLQRFPIDVVKVDQSFVSQVEKDSDSQAIVNTVFNLGSSMGLKVVAEGVETQGQLTFLEQAGCKYVQGYLFYKPMPENDLEAVLEKAYLPAP